LDVLAFASSGVPVGINIPNYHDVRENFGFKNVNLGNAYGEPSAESMLFTPQIMVDLCLKYYKPSLFVLVALHELLGHGSGKLLTSMP
jgi:dipeptidyl-peptidase-3